jgi:hypothetical protein
MTKFVTIMSETGEETEVRKMTPDALKLCLEDLRRQYGEIQARFIECLNRQISLATIIAAIEYEQERRQN